MDRFFNSKRQSVTSYLDIFKACRLCGSGGGYKMPIIQKINNEDVIDVEAELKEKIRECVSIEVHPDDRMPPLICELCVDKVNDFYEFREMCSATNARVRASLGLPPQTLSQDTSDNCILGVSGPVFPSSKEPEKPATKVSSKKEKNPPLKTVLNIAKKVSERRQTRHGTVTPPPLLTERSSRRRQAESPLPPPITKKIRFSSPIRRAPSPVLEKRKSDKRKSLDIPEVKKAGGKAKELETRPLRDRSDTKRGRESLQKVKESLLKVREAPKPKEPPKPREPPKKKEVVHPFKCEVCGAGFGKQVAHRQHQLSVHNANMTSEKMSCVPCGEWFSSVKEADAHHRWHRVSNSYYNCQRCSTDFKVLLGFNKHFQLKQCMPEQVVADVECEVCKKLFATANWMAQHKCSGPPPVPDKCAKCPETFTSKIQLKRHERKCKGVLVELNPNNPYLGELRDLSISVDRCDQMLLRIKQEPDLVTIKAEPEDPSYDVCNSDIQIKQEIKQEYNEYQDDFDDNGFGDNYSSDGGSANDLNAADEPPPYPRTNFVINPFARKSQTQVDSLSVISLRSIFSTKMFKKSRSKKKRPKLMTIKTEPGVENAFDSLVNDAPVPSENSTTESSERPSESLEQSADKTNAISGDGDVTKDISLDGEAAKDTAADITESGDANQTNENLFDDEKADEDVNNFGFDIQMAVDGAEKSLNDESVAATDEAVTSEEVPTVDLKTSESESNENVPNSNDILAAVKDNTIDDVLNSDSLINDDNVKSKEIVDEDSLDISVKKSNENVVECNDDEKDEDEGKTMAEKCGLDPEVAAMLLEDDNLSSDEAKQAIDAELDLDIASVLQGNLSPFILKKKEVKLCMEEKDTGKVVQNVIGNELESDVSLNAKENCENLDALLDDVQSETSAEEDVSKRIEESQRDEESEIVDVSEKIVKEVLESCLDQVHNVIMSKEGTRRPIDEEPIEKIPVEESFEANSEISEIGKEISGTLEEAKNYVSEELKSRDDGRNQIDDDNSKIDGETDVMDLISDSGDDCNIVDSPEKIKPTEDQLLDSDEEPAKKPSIDDEALSEDQLLAEDRLTEDKRLEDIGLLEEDKLLEDDPVESMDTAESEACLESTDNDIEMRELNVDGSEQNMIGGSSQIPHAESVIKSLEEYKNAAVDEAMASSELDPISDDDLKMES